MSQADIYDSVKKATVAIIAALPNRFPNRPFKIYGSGFCVHPDGIIVTCAHVFRAFLPSEINQQIEAIKRAPEGEIISGQSICPQAMFYGGMHGTEIHMHPVPVANVGIENGFDLAVFRIRKHPAYPQGYPTLPIAEYNELHEMMEAATCGFPLGEVLQDQFGTITSSFTKGMISSIIPAQGTARQYLKGFQLDLTATNGNSGGPVFSLATGKVFGVLQGGVAHPQTGHIVQGLAKAEPIYSLFDGGLIDKMIGGMPLPRVSTP